MMIKKWYILLIGLVYMQCSSQSQQEDLLDKEWYFYTPSSTALEIDKDGYMSCSLKKQKGYPVFQAIFKKNGYFEISSFDENRIQDFRSIKFIGQYQLQNDSTLFLNNHQKFIAQDIGLQKDRFTAVPISSYERLAYEIRFRFIDTTSVKIKIIAANKSQHDFHLFTQKFTTKTLPIIIDKMDIPSQELAEDDVYHYLINANEYDNMILDQPRYTALYHIQDTAYHALIYARSIQYAHEENTTLAISTFSPSGQFIDQQDLGIYSLTPWDYNGIFNIQKKPIIQIAHHSISVIDHRSISTKEDSKQLAPFHKASFEQQFSIQDGYIRPNLSPQNKSKIDYHVAFEVINNYIQHQQLSTSLGQYGFVLENSTYFSHNFIESCKQIFQDSLDLHHDPIIDMVPPPDLAYKIHKIDYKKHIVQLQGIHLPHSFIKIQLILDKGITKIDGAGIVNW